MRVVAGSARGRRLVAPSGTTVRPTSDRVREAVFNSLGSMGAVEGASVLDLFAGTGALGIEALSRGARRCTFIESDPRAMTALRENLTRTDTAGSARVVPGDTISVLSRPEVLGGEGVDLALADPPYAFDRWGELLELLERIGARLVVAESDSAVKPPRGWRDRRQRSYGDTVVTILERSCGVETPAGPAVLDPPADPHEENHL